MRPWPGALSCESESLQVRAHYHGLWGAPHMLAADFPQKDVQKLDYAADAWKGANPFPRPAKLEDDIVQVGRCGLPCCRCISPMLV